MSSEAKKLMELLDRYLTSPIEPGPGGTGAILQLYGMPDIAKRAVVQGLAAKHNLRFIDMREVYISQRDYSFLQSYYITYPEAATASFLSSEILFKASDQHMQAMANLEKECKAVLQSLKKQQEKDSSAALVEEAEKVETIRVLAQYEQRPSLILLGDFVRGSDEYSLNAISQLLNTRRFGSLTFTRSRFVSVIDKPTEKCEARADLFDTGAGYEDVLDSPVTEYPVFPETTREPWLEWAVQRTLKSTWDIGTNGLVQVERQNIHPLVVEFLSQAGHTQYHYRFDEVVAVYEDPNSPRRGDRRVLALTPFPNYRTWELVSNYIYAVDHRKTRAILREVIFQTIGSATGQKFTEFLLGRGYTLREGRAGHMMEDLLRETMVSGIPVFLGGFPSTGKQAVVHMLAEEINAVVIEINLHDEHSKFDQAGYPFPESPLRWLEKGSNRQDIVDRLTRAYATPKDPEWQEVQFPPSFVTQRIRRVCLPHNEKKALHDQKRVILYFREYMYRGGAADPLFWTTVFRAISNHRIYGISCDPAQLSVVAAYYTKGQGVQEMAPAFSSRFATWVDWEYTEEHAAAFMHWLSTPESQAEIGPYIYRYFKHIEEKLVAQGKNPYEKILEYMRVLEGDPSPLAKVPAPRMFSNLGKLIKFSLQEAEEYGEGEDLTMAGAMVINRSLYNLKDKVFAEPLTLEFYDKLIAELEANDYEQRLENWAGIAPAVKGMEVIKGVADSKIEDVREHVVEPFLETIDIIREIREKMKTDDSAELKSDLESELYVFIIYLKAIYGIEDYIGGVRRQLSTSMIGDAGIEFLEFYNSISGVETDNI